MAVEEGAVQRIDTYLGSWISSRDMRVRLYTLLM